MISPKIYLLQFLLLTVQYTEKKVDLFAGGSLDPSFLKISPNAWVPALVTGDVTLTESADIVK